MSKYILDTDWIIDALHGQGAAVSTLESLAPEGLALSLVTYAELYEGAIYGKDPPRALAEIDVFPDAKDLIPVSQEILEHFAEIRGSLTRHLRTQIGDFDLIIAATALTHDLTLVTRNLRDFKHIPDLSLHESAPGD